MNHSIAKGGMAVLVVGHIAGMIDMVALPLWVGVLMQTHQFTPQTAGLAVTAFLLAVALTSMALSPLFTRLPRRALATLGYTLAAGCFYLASTLSGGGELLGRMLALHALAGVGVGAGLSMTYGAMGRTPNPHRLFAVAHALLGIFAVGFLGLMPHAIQGIGGHSLFLAFCAIMLTAALALAIGYPQLPQQDSAPTQTQQANIPRAAWLAIAAVIFLTLNYGMTFSFIERVGIERGFPAGSVALVLLALGLINMVPGPLAAMLERRLSPVTVALVAPAAQALLALVVFSALDFMPYALAAAFCVFPVMFGHIFLFGLIARLDPSGRATASTPAMVMIGSSAGPVLGGTLVQTLGYSAVGSGSVVVACLAITMAFLIRQSQGSTVAARQAA